jgi:pilus assembly protein CpaC
MRKIRPFILIVAVFGTTIMHAQSPLPVSAVAASRSDAVVDTETRSVRLLVGRSTLVDVATPISRVSLTSSDVADALVTSPNQLLVNGKIPGTISMFVWDRSGSIRRFEVVVQRDLARLSEQVRQLFPGDQIDVQSNGKDVVLSGMVSNKDVIEKAINVAAGYVDKREEVVTLLQVRDSGASNQVLLRVRFAEVSRSALTDLGVGLFTGPNGYHGVLGRSTTDQTPSPTFDNSGDSSKLVFSDFLNLFFFDTKHQLGAVIKALQTKGLFQSLAEPNLISESGKEASFLAGGEIPVPIAQGSGANLAISVQYKEFGIRLNFLPVVNGNRIHIKVRPEVSTLDFTNAVILNGFRIPALSTRRTETEVELENGQTFAIAGLMNNSVNSQLQKIPGIGDIPILGLLFQSKSAQKNLSELVVMITPEILPKSSYGVTPDLPRMPEPMLPPLPDKKTVAPPPPAFTTPRTAEVVPPSAPTPKPAPVAAPPSQPAAQPPISPTSAAAAVTSLLPTTAPRPMAPAAAAPAPTVAPLPAASGAAPAAAPADSSATLPARKVETAPTAMTPVSTISRPLTDKEQAAVARSEKNEQEAAMKAAAKAAEKVAEEQREADKKQKKEDEKAAKEQARREAEAAKQGAELAKRQAEYDRQQAEQDKKQQKAIVEAEAKAKAADAAYQSELSKARKQQ